MTGVQTCALPIFFRNLRKNSPDACADSIFIFRFVLGNDGYLISTGKKVFGKVYQTIALYMRCAGYTPQEVANEVFRHAPARPKGQNRDERIEYGRRAVWYAFGTAGDIDITNINPTPEQIQGFVHETEQVEHKGLREKKRSISRMR